MPHIDNIRMFVRVFELGSMSEAARDQQVSPAVASSRISKLEKHLGVRLFNRTTRRLHPTEHGTTYYDGAIKILQAIEDYELTVTHVLCTHHHIDHVQHNQDYAERFGCPVCGHSAEASLFRDLDHLIDDGDELVTGDLHIRALQQ